MFKSLFSKLQFTNKDRLSREQLSVFEMSEHTFEFSQGFDRSLNNLVYWSY